VRLHRGHRPRPFVPIPRRIGEARGAQDIAAIEQQSGIDVPGNAVETPVDDVGFPDAREVVAGDDRHRCAHARVERLERLERDELGDPRVAELCDVRRRRAGERGQQLLVCRRPGQLLHFDADPRVRALEFGEQARDDLAFAPHRPEAQRGSFLGGLGAARHERSGGKRQNQRPQPDRPRPDHGDGEASQPPLKPARPCLSGPSKAKFRLNAPKKPYFE
jgi:hypothetical protein